MWRYPAVHVVHGAHDVSAKPPHGTTTKCPAGQAEHALHVEPSVPSTQYRPELHVPPNKPHAWLASLMERRIMTTAAEKGPGHPLHWLMVSVRLFAGSFAEGRKWEKKTRSRI